MEGRPYPTPTTPDLPEESPPFVNTGVDFAEPLYALNESQGDQFKALCAFLPVQQLELFRHQS